MNLLETKIMERIRTEGPIPFSTFMEMALYEPGLGYYASENVEIGRAGDFYTSQHVHAAFGIMIARQLEEMWEIMGRPSSFSVIEPGAGAGLTCLDILQHLEHRDVFRSLTYFIIEANPATKRKQMSILDRYSGMVRWFDSLNALQSCGGCIFSNELLDAFPVHLIGMHEELREVFVDAKQANPAIAFREVFNPPSTDALADYLHEFSIDLPKGYRTEINLRIREWLHAVAEILSEGFILTIDYGYPAQEYYDRERNRGTLLCYSRHQAHDNPYINVGKQDITSHVNFSSVKKWGEQLGFSTLGFCQQGAYFVSLGIDQVIRELFEKSSDYLFEVARIKRLLFPGTLGETHKVIVQYKGRGHPHLRGFTLKNQAGAL